MFESVIQWLPRCQKESERFKGETNELGTQQDSAGSQKGKTEHVSFGDRFRGPPSGIRSANCHFALDHNHRLHRAMSKPDTPTKPGTPNSNTLLLRRQLTELTKHPVEGFSAGLHSLFTIPDPFLTAFSLRVGLVDDNNLYEWEILIIGCVQYSIRQLTPSHYYLADPRILCSMSNRISPKV